MRVALTIAGSDPSGGAGIQADLRTFQAFGVHGMAALTALTAQNSHSVSAVHVVPPAFLRDQLRMLDQDTRPHALKTGMLATAELAATTAECIAESGWGPVVVDPVMIATSGDRLLTPEAEQVIRDRLLPLATLVTPNLDETAVLVGGEVGSVGAMEQAGHALLELGAAAALVKGGHLHGQQITDVLVTREGTQRFEHRRVEGVSTHGTGCTLSAAIAANLAKGTGLEEAVKTGIRYVEGVLLGRRS